MHKLLKLTNIFIKMELRNKAFLIPSFLFPVLMLTLMSLAGRNEGTRGNISYASFLTPGILCMAYAAVALVAIPVMLSSYREKGLLRSFKTSELPMSKVMLSIIMTQLIFMVLQTIILLFYAKLILRARFTFTVNSWMAIPVVLVGLFTLLSVGFFLSSFLPTSRSATMVGNLGNLVAIFLGGVFFPTDVWPHFLQPLTWINPLTWIIEALRKSVLFGSMSFGSFYTEIAVLFFIGCICFVLSLKLFRYE